MPDDTSTPSTTPTPDPTPAPVRDCVAEAREWVNALHKSADRREAAIGERSCAGELRERADVLTALADEVERLRAARDQVRAEREKLLRQAYNIIQFVDGSWGWLDDTGELHHSPTESAALAEAAASVGIEWEGED